MVLLPCPVPNPDHLFVQLQNSHAHLFSLFQLKRGRPRTSLWPGIPLRQHQVNAQGLEG